MWPFSSVFEKEYVCDDECVESHSTRRWIDDKHAAVPDYLERHYWWAYVRPWAVRIFDRPWLVNLILWGFYGPLCREVMRVWKDDMAGKTIQITCCYGELTPTLSANIDAAGGELTLIDASHAQLDNISKKLPRDARVGIYCRNAEDLGFETGRFDRALLFLLPHEVPRDARRKIFDEAFRVVRPGGTLLVIEFGKPRWWHPLRFIWHPFLRFAEPFASDMWTQDLVSYFPEDKRSLPVERKDICAGFYQRLLVRT